MDVWMCILVFAFFQFYFLESTSKTFSSSKIRLSSQNLKINSNETNRTTKPWNQNRLKKRKFINSLGYTSARIAFGFLDKTYQISKLIVKNSIDRFSPKHVTLDDICGKWKMNQEIALKEDILLSYPATIDFSTSGHVITEDDQGKKHSGNFAFSERIWPRFCTIRFDAYAFQDPNTKELVKLIYKGYFKRSIMNPQIVLLRGNVYRKEGLL